MVDQTRDDANGGNEPGSAERVPFAVFVLFEAGLAPIALLLGWALGQHPLADFSWDGDAAAQGVIASVPLLVLLAVSLRWPVGPLGRIRAFFDREMAPSLKGCEWPDLALISVAAGVGEEMLFRGVIQGALSRWRLGTIGAIGAASALFGLMHPVSAAYVVLAGLMGGYLGFVWLVSGNLLTVIVAHAVYDFIALLALLHEHHKDLVED